MIYLLYKIVKFELPYLASQVSSIQAICKNLCWTKGWVSTIILSVVSQWLPGSCCWELLVGHGYDSKILWFDSTQSQKVLIWLNLWITMALQDLIQINSRLTMVFWNLIHIDSWLKMLPEYFDLNQLTTQKSFHNFDSNWLVT